jgi:hypothetical protein
MKLPLLAFGDGDLNVFPSVADAVAYMEPIDVREGRWQAYDSEGMLLEVSVKQDQPRGWLARLLGGPREVTVIVAAGAANRAAELERQLRAYFSALCQPERFGITADWITAATLPDLIEKAVRLEL